MGGWIKSSGIWKELLAVWRRTSTIWQPIFRIRSKETTGWELLWKPKYLPPNLIVMGDATLSSMDNWLDGDGSSYSDKFLMSGINAATGGSLTHNGADHGISGQQVSSHVANPRDSNKTWLWTYPAGGLQSSHNHWIQHTHNDVGTESNTPVYVRLTPYVINSNALINAGGLFLTELSSAPTDFTMVSTYNNRWLRFYSTPGAAGTGTHSHYMGFNAGVTTMPNDGTCGDSSYWNKAHYHTFNHAHTSTNNPAFTTLRLMRCDNDIVDQDDIPIGAISPFTDNNIPGGWERYTYGDGVLLKLLNAATTFGGSLTHSHPDQTQNTGGMIVTQTSRGNNNSADQYTYGNAHSHSVTHRHTGQVNWLPQYKEIVFAKKIS